jgi:hypothetical protein
MSKLSSLMMPFLELCHPTFHFAFSASCRKPYKMPSSTVECSTSMQNCASPRMQSILLCAIRDRVLTSKKQRKTPGLALSAWRNELNWWGDGFPLTRNPSVAPPFSPAYLSKKPHEQPLRTATVCSWDHRSSDINLLFKGGVYRNSTHRRFLPCRDDQGRLVRTYAR